MTHANAPLTPTGRLRLVCRVETGRPITHVAAEAGIARQTLSKWVGRYRAGGDAALVDRRSRPWRSPSALPPSVVDRIAQLRRRRKWSARLIAVELREQGVRVSMATVSRWLVRLGLNHRRALDPSGAVNRMPRRIVARYPGHMLHLDVKKVGWIPDGGGWRAHGRDSAQHRAAGRAKTAGTKTGYAYLHSAVDGYSRLAYTEHLPNEQGSTCAAFFARARAFFATHGITRLTRVVTDNGAGYRAHAFHRAVAPVARHQRLRPFTPRHNGKVERYQRVLAEELLYARTFTSEDQRAEAITQWNIHYNYHRPHTATGDQPPASRLRHGVTNVMRSYT